MSRSPGTMRVAVTHDGRIRYKPNEKNAVIENNVALRQLTLHLRFHPTARAPMRTRHGNRRSDSS